MRVALPLPPPPNVLIVTIASLMFIAGDPSGDRHASRVLRCLGTMRPDFRFFGIGGPAMQEQGLEPLLPFIPFNRMGFKEVAVHLPFFLNAKRLLVREMRRRRPDMLVCVDYPGLNIPMMHQARRRGIPVVWYIVPQVWAWKRKRAAVLGANASFIGTVFPFESELFRGYPARTEFVGHPLIEALGEHRGGGNPTERAVRMSTGELRLAVVPGSRRQEVVALLRPMMEAFRLLRASLPAMTATVSRLAQLEGELFLEWSSEPGVTISEEPLARILDRSDIALVKSGTATLETALAGVPMVVAYRTSGLTYRLLKSFVRTSHIGLPNIVAGRTIVPECIQEQVTPARLSREILAILDSKERYTGISRELGLLKEKLGERQASRIMAERIIEVLESTRASGRGDS